MKAGKLRHRVTIQTATENQDSFGQAVKTWDDTATRYASIEPLTGRELFNAVQVQPDVSHRVTLRHYEGLTPANRLKFGARYFEIKSVLNTEERGLETVALCVEKV